MIETEERLTPPAAPAAGETGETITKPARQPLGPVRYFLAIVALGGICAFALSQSGLLELFGTTAVAEEAASDLCNVNRATVDELKDLPDINKKIAEAIISERPFKSIDDLLKVKGIGEKKLEKIRPFVIVE